MTRQTKMAYLFISKFHREQQPVLVISQQIRILRTTSIVVLQENPPSPTHKIWMQLHKTLNDVQRDSNENSDKHNIGG